MTNPSVNISVHPREAGLKVQFDQSDDVQWLEIRYGTLMQKITFFISAGDALDLARAIENAALPFTPEGNERPDGYDVDPDQEEYFTDKVWEYTHAEQLAREDALDAQRDAQTERWHAALDEGR